jgi:AcrR family transcriptional regulator
MGVRKNVAANRSAAERRLPLTRQGIVEAAMRIVDADGLPALTMRRLAGDLGVATTAIYWHLRTRDEVLLGMLEVAVEEIEVPHDEGALWVDDLRTVCRSMRSMLRRHPWIPLVHGAFPGMSAPRYLTAVSAVGTRAGFDADQIALVARLLGTFVVGSTLRETSEPPAHSARDATLARWAELGEPELAQLMPALARVDDDALFERGLSYLLAGLSADAASPDL